MIHTGAHADALNEAFDTEPAPKRRELPPQEPRKSRAVIEYENFMYKKGLNPKTGKALKKAA